MALRDLPPARGYYHLLQTAVLPWVRRHGIRADQMTCLGALVALAVPLGFGLHPLAGLVLMIVSASADALDGHLAREAGQPSSWGAFLDSSLDRLSDGGYLLGFWVLFYQNGQALAGSLLLWPALVATLMISYVKARAEALGGSCPVGFMERAARIVFLCLWALVLALLPNLQSRLLPAGALIYLGLTGSTVVQRMRYVRRQL